MNPRELKSNQELLEYLTSLRALLAGREEHKSAEKVGMAAKFYGGSSSEFFHEARLALRSVENEGAPRLSSDEKSDLRAVLKQIEQAFQRIGGG